MLMKVCCALGIVCLATVAAEAAPGPRATTTSARIAVKVTTPAVLVSARIEPVPEAAPIPMPVGCDLYECVRYKNECKISPCAEPMIVSVKDPCSCKKTTCCCEAPKCVNVKICVPPCDCPKVKVTRHGFKTRYDFGKYAVDIISKPNGDILVDYDA